MTPTTPPPSLCGRRGASPLQVGGARTRGHLELADGGADRPASWTKSGAGGFAWKTEAKAVARSNSTRSDLTDGTSPTTASAEASRHSSTLQSFAASQKQHTPGHSDAPCHHRVCVDAVTPSGRGTLLACLRKAGKDVTLDQASSSSSNSSCACSLREGTGARNKLTALVSLPGSGNTWVRGLLERATGVCTGSMWCDASLKLGGFCGDGVRNRSTLVVKIHNPAIRWVGEVLRVAGVVKLVDKIRFDAAIVIHRDPYDATVAERNRAAASSSHRGNAHVSYFGRSMFGKYFCRP